MNLIVVHGPPGVGKRSVAKELVAQTGYKLFNYHALGSVLGPIFGFGSAPFLELRDAFYPRIIRQAMNGGVTGLIATFIFEPSIKPEMFAELTREIGERGGRVFFAGLTCDEAEHERRVETPSRVPLGQLATFEPLRQLLSRGEFAFPDLPGPSVSIDTTHLDPRGVARSILEQLPGEMRRSG
jgi:hypothetical protein